MEPTQGCGSILIAWRGQNFIIEMNPGATLKDLGIKLQDLTNAKADTIRLLVPAQKSSKLLYPFSDEHGSLSLDEVVVLKGKPIRMMGVPKEELEEVTRNAIIDNRIAGFGEEERRLKQRSSYLKHVPMKLPTGTFIFCDFRTLSLPGIELSPTASKALELLHKLASDPGIVAIMNKYRWRVGILTEMAPVGYVGVSPKCILGFNKNRGEEISLRLRTDDLKGFRKYESIKRLFCMSLYAHMVHSEHDQNFYALDSKLNREVTALDWTKSRSHTLSRHTLAEIHEEETDIDSTVISSQKLGGQISNPPDARAASASAALQRLVSLPQLRSFEEPNTAPSPSTSSFGNVSEPELYDRQGDECMAIEPDVGLKGSISVDTITIAPENGGQSQNMVEPDQVVSSITTNLEPSCQVDISGSEESGTGDLHSTEPDSSRGMLMSQTFEPDQSIPELQMIQDPVTLFCRRLESSIKMLKDVLKPSETQLVLQTLIKIIRNVVEHPDDIKYKKLRKGNPTIQRNIIAHAEAVNILSMVGFFEDIIVDEWGKADAFLMLKRNDPGLLWLAKSSLETHIA